MPFHSLVFLYVFLPIAYVGFWKLRGAGPRSVWLTLTGYAFYGSWDPRFCGLMLASTGVAYAAGRAIGHWGRRPVLLVVPVSLDLALLGYFKYLRPHDVMLPAGISFYTIHTMTYVIDCWRGAVRPARSGFRFAAYVSFFPQLVAGPITRFGQVEGDLTRLGEANRLRNLDEACLRFAQGLAKKVLLADSIASVIDPGFARWTTLTAPDSWLCVLGYAYQLYFDFSGYSDMAVGLGLAFGVRLPENFNAPFRADSIADFWRRWHISLSTALRDYLYIPLGGGRSHPYRNLWITMLVCGAWHGASWGCVLWGAYNAALLCTHRAGRLWWERLPVGVRRATTFGLFVFGLSIFRGLDPGRLFSGSLDLTLDGSAGLLLLLGIAGALAHSPRWRPAPVWAVAAVFVVSLAGLYAGRQSPFLYFQF